MRRPCIGVVVVAYNAAGTGRGDRPRQGAPIRGGRRYAPPVGPSGGRRAVRARPTLFAYQFLYELEPAQPAPVASWQSEGSYGMSSASPG
jgi:hypothetical protein